MLQLHEGEAGDKDTLAIAVTAVMHRSRFSVLLKSFRLVCIQVGCLVLDYVNLRVAVRKNLSNFAAVEFWKKKKEVLTIIFQEFLYFGTSTVRNRTYTLSPRQGNIFV